MQGGWRVPGHIVLIFVGIVVNYCTGVPVPRSAGLPRGDSPTDIYELEASKLLTTGAAGHGAGSVFVNALQAVIKGELKYTIPVFRNASSSDRCTSVTSQKRSKFKFLLQYRGEVRKRAKVCHFEPIRSFNDTLLADIQGLGFSVLKDATQKTFPGGDKAPIHTNSTLYNSSLPFGQWKLVWNRFEGYPPDPPPAMVAIDDAMVTNGIVLNCKQKVVITAGACEDLTNSLSRRARFQSTSKHRKLFVAGTSWSSNYGHFVMEVLPRIVMALEFLKSNTDVLINTVETRFAAEYLSLLGISPKRLLPNKQFMARHAMTMYYSQPMMCMGPHTLLCHKARSIVFREFGLSSMIQDEPTSNLRVLYTLRNDFRDRFAHFRSLVQAIAEIPGVDAVFKYMSNVKEQIIEFNKADVVIGSHGASFSNVLWMRSGTDIVEIQTTHYGVLCYYHLASKVGVHYHMVVTDSRQLLPALHENYTDVEIDLLSLKNILHSIKMRREHNRARTQSPKF